MAAASCATVISGTPTESDILSMTRFKVILLALFLVLGVALFLVFGRPLLEDTTIQITAVSYDVDADGVIEITRWNIGDSLVIWEWDRDGDGNPELIAYDAEATPEGGLRPSGTITTWDWGGDAVLDIGNVPSGVEALLQQEDVVAARSAPAGGDIALVGPDIRRLADDIEAGYDDWRLDGFRMPIVGASLPRLDNLLPGEPRAYRSGIHQGFDMYGGQIGVPTGYSGPVVAAKSGKVIRAMHDFTEMTPTEYQEAIATSRAAGTTPPDILDKLRGRQVWIDHGNGIASRYVHLSGIVAEITGGEKVDAGEIVGFVGNSGTEDGVNGTRGSAHLHFELRIDDRYLGEGLSRAEIRELAGRILNAKDSG